jgi:DNA polymerase-3 subunit gamma/tau
VVFVLATTDPQRVLPTILSRCQRFDFRRIPLEALEGHLRYIATEEQIGITAEALHVVAQRAQGGLRDAESLLDQLSLLPAPIEPMAVWELVGAVPEQELLALATALARFEPLGVVEACRELLDRGREPSAVLQGLTSLLRDLVLAAVAPDRLELTSFSPQFRPQLPELAQQLGTAKLLQWQSQLKGSEQQLRHSVQPRLWLEVLVLGLLAQPTGVSAPPGQSTAAVQAAPMGSAPVSPQARGQAKAPDPAPTTSPEPAPAAQGGPTAGANLPELWQQILTGLELPSTRMLLSQQATLVRLDGQRAVVRVAGNWMAMVQGRLPLLERAMQAALGSPRQVILEGAEGHQSTAPPAKAVPPPAPRPQSEPHSPGQIATPIAVALTAAVAVVTPAPAPTPAGIATAAPPAAAPTPVELPAQRALPGSIDEKAKRLADFFNGEVISDFSDDMA